MRKNCIIAVCAIGAVLILSHERADTSKKHDATGIASQKVASQAVHSYDSTLDYDTSVPLADSPRQSTYVETIEQTYELETIESEEILITEDLQDTVAMEDLEESSAESDLQIVGAQYTCGGFEIGEYVSVPIDLPTSVKLATDYRSYNIVGTPHWRLQQVAWTDEYGLRRFNSDYIVGMGTYYSIDIGDRFEVTYDTGSVMTVMLGDNKADVLTDVTRRYEPVTYWDMQCASVLEFIADLEIAPSEVWIYGTYDCLDEFKGNIVSIRYLGRDTSADWDTYY